MGQKFRNLVIQDRLGEGAMGVVYLASHPVLRMPFVIKIFKNTSSADLLKEAHLAARVRSPHVVDVVDAGEEGRQPFIVHRYVDGVDLGEILNWQQARGRRLSVGVVSRMMADVARGLHAIHQAGVIHRDIKPPNLFLQGNGDTMVGDFGIAVSTATHTKGPLAGTPRYLAPEVWLDEEATRRSDLYALGATAHELLTGSAPFIAKSVPALALAHCRSAYSPPESECPQTAAFFALVATLLAKTPTDRPASAGRVADAFDALATPLPALSIGPTSKPACSAGHVGPLRLTLRMGDLAQLGDRADVIVNAANRELKMRRGVSRALRLVAGDPVETEAMAAGPVTMGDVVWTPPGDLDATHLAHAVAALNGAICIQRAALRTLLQTESRGARCVAFPALGTGVGQVPMEVGAQLLLATLRTFAWLEPESVKELVFVLHGQEAFTAAQGVAHGVR